MLQDLTGNFSKHSLQTIYHTAIFLPVQQPHRGPMNQGEKSLCLPQQSKTHDSLYDRFSKL